MFKKLTAIFAILAVVLAIGCGSGKQSSSDQSQNQKPAATKSATSAAPTEEATAEANSGDSAGALQSLSFLTGGMFGGSDTGTPSAVDPNLASMLIASTDLPDTFASAGEDEGFTTTMPGGGEATMALRTFSEGDPNTSEMTPTIVSAAMTMPQEALDQYDEQLAKLDQVTTDDLRQAMGGASVMGIEFKELSVDKISLGDGGISMHMVMDMSGLAEAFGGLTEDTGQEIPTSLSFDMYVFKKGGAILMVMTMLPEGASSAVDIESLAKIMESRAP